MAPKAWKLTCSLDLSNLHPSHLRRGWPMDFSWHKVHFELSMIQEGRCKDSLSFYFASNAKTLMHLSVKQRAEQEGRQLALPILSFHSPWLPILPVTQDWLSVTLFLIHSPRYFTVNATFEHWANSPQFERQEVPFPTCFNNSLWDRGVSTAPAPVLSKTQDQQHLLFSTNLKLQISKQGKDGE